jgi:hypothetical protein
MIFQFPDSETLLLAVSSAQVPLEVSQAAAEFAVDDDGHLSVQSKVAAAAKSLSPQLKKLGVKSIKAHVAANIQSVASWPQILPLVKKPSLPELTSNTPVLFEMPASEMASVVTEMLRLGNDRQSFLSLEGPDGKDRVLLKVFGPPYYTLLRAIDAGEKSAISAFLETNPQVWVQLGYEHPLAGQIKPAGKQLLLLRPERDWSALPEGPFQDIYEVLDFKLPAGTLPWHESNLKGKLSVPLRLVAGNAADVAEMWVLLEKGVEQLDALVRDADERLLARLAFAVANVAGQAPTIILRTRPSKLSPPVLTLENTLGFKPYWKLPNLFLPVGQRLSPTLRRDAVRRLLADDPSQLVWLMPDGHGKFTPETLPDNAFRPLQDWVEYIIDREHESLQAWIQATKFDFDGFICKDDLPPDGPRPADPAPKSKPKRSGGETPTASGKEVAVVAETTNLAPLVEEVTILEVAPNQLKEKRQEVEEEFLAISGELDSPQRQALWPQLAQLNGALKDAAETAVCWNHSYWVTSPIPVENVWAWLKVEDLQASKTPTEQEFQAILNHPAPSIQEIRAMVARSIYSSLLKPIPESFLKHLSAIREFVERHENVLGIRTIWLAWVHLAKVGGGPPDVLALARVRDRLLQRLLAEGLNRERDLPYFLRAAGEGSSDRMRVVREKALRVYRLVENWHTGEDVKVNKPYVDLMFAFGLARLGEMTTARDLMNSAVKALKNKWNPDPIHQRAHDFLADAFVYRIEHALQGKPHSGPLSDPLLKRLETIDEGRSLQGMQPRYAVDRFREQSWIIEPHDRIDPYLQNRRSLNEIHRVMASLQDVRDGAKIRQTVSALLKNHPEVDDRMTILFHFLPIAYRAGEEFTVGLLQMVPSLIQPGRRVGMGVDSPSVQNEKQAKLLEKSLILAGHYDRHDLVVLLFNTFLDFISHLSGNELYTAINLVAREGLRNLRRLGLKNDIDRFLRKIRDQIEQGKPLTYLRTTTGTQWPDILGALLALAEGFQYFGSYDQAKPYLDEARQTIYRNAQEPKERALNASRLTKLVTSYISALAQGEVDDALSRIEELFQKMEKLPNSYTTASHFSRFHLNIVESVIRSMINENFTMGEQTRRWLDEDEYLVRRRIHADMRHLLAQSGL